MNLKDGDIVLFRSEVLLIFFYIKKKFKYKLNKYTMINLLKNQIYFLKLNWECRTIKKKKIA